MSKFEEIVKAVKAKEEKNSKRNYTYRLSTELVKKFRLKCKTDKISMNSVVEELVRDFMKDAST